MHASREHLKILTTVMRSLRIPNNNSRIVLTSFLSMVFFHFLCISVTTILVASLRYCNDRSFVSFYVYFIYLFAFFELTKYFSNTFLLLFPKSIYVQNFKNLVNMLYYEVYHQILFQIFPITLKPMSSQVKHHQNFSL